MKQNPGSAMENPASQRVRKFGNTKERRILQEKASGKHTQRNGGLLMTFRESYPPIVLRDGNADHMGKGWAEIRSPQRKHYRTKSSRRK